ncbi:cytochrome d ubiquinol oxidase subunit II [Thiorhodococcus mannitoliphagus]|uniref:Cytochrome d ubiquinol oxidase subunit II n=1 Tax=Thiorhodococcus mannitoliphagus TaxID=329406 RepID=A0A6P1DSB9_9GAMM|nr:cytochrome d ubiquinol oxidase subunit II [Thiorhodococcus mannitoliphagus]NEX20073.1 cytochrome d ubiquinol oxidase subunit II [Thiorhodococcus mannitoliphagus]
MEILIVVVSLAALVSFLWLVVVAFKTHVLWGLACLFLPFATLIFAILNWDRAAKPFLTHVASSALIFAVAWSYFASVMPMLDADAMQLQAQNIQEVQQQILRRVQNGEMTEDEAKAEMQLAMQAALKHQPYRPSFMGQERAVAAVKIEAKDRADMTPEAINARIEDAIAREDARRAQAAAEAAAAVPKKPTYVRRFVAKDVSSAGQDIGKAVSLTTINGLERSGDLVDISRKGELIVEQRAHGGKILYTIGPDLVGNYKVQEWIER